MSSWIVIGDVHSTPHSIVEAEALLNWCADLARLHKAKGCLLLGDLFDTHQNIHLSVMYSYMSIFQKNSDLEWIMIPGNHDHSVHGNRLEHALLPFKAIPNVKVFDCPEGVVESYAGMDFAVFCRTEEEFLAICAGKKNDILICHQEFTGADYGNGFYSPHGTDVKKVPYGTIISGHIHADQWVGNCYYPGAPRWFTVSDANKGKYVNLLKDGKFIKQFSTDAVCTPIYKLQLDATSELPVLKENARYILEVKGTPTFLNKINHKYAGKAEIRGVVDADKSATVKESVGIEESLEKFILQEYKLKYLNDKQAFWLKLQEELNQ